MWFLSLRESLLIAQTGSFKKDNKQHLVVPGFSSLQLNRMFRGFLLPSVSQSTWPPIATGTKSGRLFSPFFYKPMRQSFGIIPKKQTIKARPKTNCRKAVFCVGVGRALCFSISYSTFLPSRFYFRTLKAWTTSRSVCNCIFDWSFSMLPPKFFKHTKIKIAWNTWKSWKQNFCENFKTHFFALFLFLPYFKNSNSFTNLMKLKQ